MKIPTGLRDPGAAYRLEVLSDEIGPLVREIERGNRRAAALAYELQQKEMPGLRAEAERLIEEADRAIERVFKEPIAKLRAQIFENPESATAIEKMARANEAYSRAESAAGNRTPGRPADFGGQVALVLQALYAFHAQDPNQWWAMQKGAIYPPAPPGFHDDTISQMIAGRNFIYPS